MEWLQPDRWLAGRRAAVRRAADFSAECIVPQYEALYQRVAGGPER
ncbi:MAG: hypothetical protein GWN07_27965 [Actinobacteria bacterium]|nr:hypothetical protein [Actinomycetota bacterium]